jgi:hypothetical protein
MGGQNFTNAYGYGREDAFNSSTYLHVPQAFSTIQSAMNVAASGQTIKVSGTQTLTGNVIIPTNITINFVSGSSINLNSYSVVSTGGTINNNGAGITGLRASLESSAVIKGLCGRIQAAATYAGTEN